MSDLQLGVLGPLRLQHDGRSVPITAAKQRTLLALLALRAGRTVSIDELVAALWAEDPPATAPRTLQSLISRLRAALPATPPVITRRRPGYQLEIPPQQVDAHQFTQLVAEAVDQPAAKAAATLRRALDLWYGPALADLQRTPVVEAEAVRLTEQHDTAQDDYLDAELQLGHHQQLLGQLHALTATTPLRERTWHQLMLALYRSGRQADALTAYQRARTTLTTELGIEPGPELQQLHQRILAADPTLTPPAPDPSPTLPDPASIPRQLPADSASFAGRTAELAQLDSLLATGDRRPVVISAIDGTAGVGKTALAVHWAHRVADQFPDGQLFLDLHGFTEAVPPVEPADALDRLLRALGVPAERIPAEVEDRAGLWRSILAHRRMLIVLDNAAAEAQVTPLLPGTPECPVLVTSRRRLSGLEAAHLTPLDVLPLADAVALFTRTAGEQRLSTDTAELVAEIVQLCGRLPLAIRIAAARLRSHPTWRLSHLVGRLRDQQHRLGELAAGQRNVTAALDLSYQHLSADQQEAYRLLGLHPGTEFDAYATAALLDSTLRPASRALDQLIDFHLLHEPTPGRYRFHDLTRAHAAHTAARDKRAPTNDAALGRLLDHYRHTASTAMDTAYPHEREHRPQVPPSPTPSPELPDPAAALAWLDTELPNLLAAARSATEHRRPEHLLHLSTILHRHLRSHGPYHDAETLHQQALDTAGTTGDQLGQLNSLVGLGDIHWRQGRYAHAADHYQQALHIARGTSHRAGELAALTGLAQIHRRQGRYAHAADHYQQALHIARGTCHRAGELDVLLGLGDIHRLQGQYQQATDHFEHVLRIARAIGHHAGGMTATCSLGDIHRRQGRYAQAADHFEQALQVARATGHRPGELTVLVGLGDIHRLQGQYQQATDHYQQALQVARAAGYRAGELTVLTGLGYVHRRQGRYAQAADHYQRLLDLAHESDDRNWQFEAWQGLGRLSHATGDPDAAIAHHERALTLAGALSQPDDQARAHDGLAHAHHARAQHERARRHWQHALDILTDLGIEHTEDEETNTAAIRAHLTALAERGSADPLPAA